MSHRFASTLLFAACFAPRLFPPEGEGGPLVVHHIRDWHSVPRDLFSRDIGLQGAAFEAAYRAHLDAVESVQKEQLALLADLAETKGAKIVYLEGLTAEGMEAWRALCMTVREQTAEEAATRNTRDEAKAIAEKSEGERKRQALRIVAEAEMLLADTREVRLKAGAVALLDVVEVRPLDSMKALDEAAPVGRPGALVIPPEALARRHAAWARSLSSARAAEIIVITGARHDLETVLKQTGRRVALKRHTTPSVKRMMGE